MASGCRRKCGVFVARGDGSRGEESAKNKSLQLPCAIPRKLGRGEGPALQSRSRLAAEGGKGVLKGICYAVYVFQSDASFSNSKTIRETGGVRSWIRIGNVMRSLFIGRSFPQERLFCNYF